MKIFSWGSNSHGQLGQGIQLEQLLIPTEIKLSINAKCIVGGGKHTVILTDDNKVFICGDNSKGQLGINSSLTALHRFQLVSCPLRIIKVTCGWDFTLAITENADVFGWGSNSFGQLGFPISRVTILSTPTKIFDKKVIDISAGLRHSALITSEGVLYTSGYARKGQLGINDCSCYVTEAFTEVKYIKNCEQISCGECHCIVKTANNVFYSWGSNRHGQLGLNPKDFPISLIPIKIDLPIDEYEKCHLHCGWTHNCVLTETGKVITWGRNNLGQLGLKNCDNWIPSLLTSINKKIIQLSLGSHHCIALTEDGEVCTWGWNEHGNCGNGSTDNVLTPNKIIQNQKIKLIGSGAAHSFLSFCNRTLLSIANPDIVPVRNYDNIEGIAVIENALEYNEFFESFMLLNKPCLIKNLSKLWTCKSNWIKENSLNVEYFREHYRNVEVPISNCDKREFNIQKKCTMMLHDYLNYWESYKDSASKKDCLYLKDWHFFRDFPNEDIYRVPFYFASDWLNEYYNDFPSLNDDYRFVYIGPKGSWTPFHTDVFTSFSWSVNVCGRKKWIIMPPGMENHFKDNLGNLVYNIELTNMEKEKLKDIPVYFIEQQDGEGFFIPSGWHHQVWNLDDTISINHNWINGCNVEFVWESLKRNLTDVKKEISDCRDMENWSSQCQLILSANFGFDYQFFHSFLVHIARARLSGLMKNESLLAMGNWSIDENHMKFDLKQALNVLNALEKNEDFIELFKASENLNHSLEFLDSVNSLLINKIEKL